MRVKVADLSADVEGAYLSMAGVRLHRFSFTNEEIKTLPTAGGTGHVELVAAEPGFLLKPCWAIIVADFALGGYGNVHEGSDGNAFLGIETNNGAGLGLTYCQNIDVVESWTLFSDLFGEGKRVLRLTEHHDASASHLTAMPDLQDYADCVGNIVLSVQNGSPSDGDFIDGDPANTLKGYVAYARLPLP